MAALAESSSPVYLFGCGEYGLKILRLAEKILEKGRIAGFLDNNPRLAGGSVAGLPVFRPADPGVAAPEPAVLDTARRPPVAKQMIEECRRLGYRHILPRADLLTLHEPPDPRLHIEHPGAEAARDIWADQDSAALYQSILRCQTTLAEADLPPIDWEGNQYFHPRVPAGQYRDFVDGGAYDGDTFRVFKAFTRDAFANYYAFEPNPDLRAGFRAEAGDDARVRCFDTVLWNAPGTLSFSPDAQGLGGSKVSSDGGVALPADTLDRLLAGNPVSFIKMDIEGCEPEALEGARGTLRAQRPALAICVYHRPWHLWEIPLWIHRLGLDYSLYLGLYTVELTESVCYAVPRGF